MADLGDRLSVMEAMERLGDLPLDVMSDLIDRVRAQRVLGGQTVFAAGEPSRNLFFVGTGRLARIAPDGHREPIRRGAIVGWNAFYHASSHDADLTAERDSILYVLAREDFDALMEKHPALAGAFLTALTPRAATAAETAVADVQVGLFVVGDLGPRSGEVLDRLSKPLSGAPGYCAVDRAMFCDLARIQPTTEELAGHVASDVFAQLEHEHPALVFTGRPDDGDAWNARIAGQVDTIVLIVSDRTQRLPRWLRGHARRGQQRVGLVVVSEEGTRQAPSVDLWDEVAPDWQYRVQLGEDRRWDSVARMALGRAVNIVLGGGGALGALHCGMLKAMEEAGFPVDSIGGTSVGACIAAGYSLGDDPLTIATKFRKIFLEDKAFKKYAPPAYGLVDPKVFDACLRWCIDNKLLEEADIPVFAVTVNLTRTRLETVRRGPAWEAMRMSASLPVILPPFVKDGCAYIDGGVMSNFPVAEAKAQFPGRYVGCTFSLPELRRIKTSYSDLPGRWGSVSALAGVGKQSRDIPTIGGLVASALTLTSASALGAAIGGLDVLFTPPVPEGAGFMSFERFDEMFRIGYDYGTGEMERLSESGELSRLAGFGPDDPTKEMIVAP